MLLEIVDNTICYGRSVITIGEQLYGADDTLSSEQKTKKAQKVYDAVLAAFPNLRKLMISTQNHASKFGYVETILGRRRHIPDMMLPEFEFLPMPGYVNPDIDPLDLKSLDSSSEGIPERIQSELLSDFKKLKYFGQIVKKTNELREKRIKVINNRPKITEASRQCVNCVDLDTEILTLSGFKKYNEVVEGEEILSFDMDKQEIVKSRVSHIHLSTQPTEVYRFDSPVFSSVCTEDHRWVAYKGNQIPKIHSTSDIVKDPCNYSILRSANNSFFSCNYTEDELRLMGWIIMNSSYTNVRDGVNLHQSVYTLNDQIIYADIIRVLDRLDIEYFDSYDVENSCHNIHLSSCDLIINIVNNFSDNKLTWNFVSQLSQIQAQILMQVMLQQRSIVNHSTDHTKFDAEFTCTSKYDADIFQYIAFIAGYATTLDIISNSLYVISIVFDDYNVASGSISKSITNGVWCVTTSEGTWIARRNGNIYITGNSVVQGSAAEMTKIAMLRIHNSDEWKAIGGRLLVPVHDEIIAEVPIDKWKEGGEILSRMMSEAGNFLPFPIKCDVETTLRWYGLSYPCPYDKPAQFDIDNWSEDNIKWVQYHLVELEVNLPVYPSPDGEKPRGDAVHGVNGIMSEELKIAIFDYINRYNICRDDFISTIEKHVQEGNVDNAIHY